MTSNSIGQTAVDLAANVTAARHLLMNLDETVVRHRPEPGRWSLAEVIGHLVDSACNNHQRFIRAQSVAQFSFPKYEQNLWVANANYHEMDWEPLVDLWCLYNLMLSHVIEHIPEHALKTPCTIEPYETCTLEFLVVDYLDHLNHHLGKIRERLGH